MVPWKVMSGLARLPSYLIAKLTRLAHNNETKDDKNSCQLPNAARRHTCFRLNHLQANTLNKPTQNVNEIYSIFWGGASATFMSIKRRRLMIMESKKKKKKAGGEKGISLEYQLMYPHL